MKISWGIGIVLLIVGFLVISIGTIVFSFSQDVNLVTDDYYEQEVVYQQQINKVKRSKDLSEQLEIKVLDSSISVIFPSMFKSENIKGDILLYRPSDRTNDLKTEIKLDSTNHLILSTKQLIKGMWRLKVDWSVDITTYYNEKIIMVN